ncbi:bifunctional acetate--CoA ligase family protein/GNAT family N-acetyltransferase [Limnofasciculus baicalensis]|uniref:Bifunctional acetate--CoA ligase family protein/GNAT family N-acetyltransferase n=1 Tax=Limnofasciculus baicalensis BBK-W-15 TaxID=2699891 RepID=A0AAE3GP18_9CYAN|nr:bifunctional acetate--CoA ligase family protein/GNAT family N-acetyltransferase [Limnofasciculus baicalensis]MCP2727386.1 bifunctional acetate--CoA ligase family protein/GNAT family N-acetyltransferase [Limnofasciculus baicalensis BBK-W-15]
MSIANDSKEILRERAYDILRSEYRPLNAIFAPKTIAVIGATERLGSVGRTLLWNLITNSFGGTVFPVNPKRFSVLGIKAYPTVAAIGEPVDLAIIATPAPTVPSIIRECIAAGVKGAIVLSAGFKEIGTVGIELEQQLLAQIRESQMRLIGPNCLGVMNPITGLNATFANSMARPGKVGFISQSGALCTAILDWSHRENVGFSAFVSLGSMLDVNWGHLIDYLGDDPHTESIVIYMESIGDARSFLSAAREVALTKPIIVLKAGRTEAASKAAASHTGSLTGSDAVLDAAFRRCGVLRVNTIADLFDMAEVLAKQPRPKGPHLTIITNAGGPGVLATDALIATGGELTELSADAIASLNAILPPHWSHHNPIDILGDADPNRYAKTLEIAANDPNSNGLLVILTPQAMTDPSQTAQQLKPYAKLPGKPILASWMGGSEVSQGELLLNQAGIPTYPYPDAAVQVFSYLWRSSYNLRELYETPVLPTSCTIVKNRQDAFSTTNHEFSGGAGFENRQDACSTNYEFSDGAGILPACIQAAQIIDAARQEGRTILTEVESKQILAAYGIPTVQTCIATTEDRAVECARAIGYPVVLKLFSKTITHKTDVGGVQLNLMDENAVRNAYQAIKSGVQALAGEENFLGVTVQPMIELEGYELIIGSNLDPQFGPVLLFGTGGQLVEVFQDRSIALPPLNTTLARRMMEQTRIYKALNGVRGRKAVDLPALEQLMVQFSQLVVEQRWIKEIDINPLLATSEQLLALDARIILHESDIDENQLPKLAIRPYPTQYATPWTMKNGISITIRPIRPEDEPLMIQFHKTLSEESVYFRYFHLIKLSQRIAHERLTRLCFIDYDREMALVADYQNPETGTHEILAVARLSKLHGMNEAEFALLVSDSYQCQGLGTELLDRLIQVGQDEKLDRITAEILCDNSGMQRVCKKLGFQILRGIDSNVVKAEIQTSKPSPKGSEASTHPN